MFMNCQLKEPVYFPVHLETGFAKNRQRPAKLRRSTENRVGGGKKGIHTPKTNLTR